MNPGAVIASTRRCEFELPPLALYVHFPWCVEKCPYCDFNSHARSGPLPERALVDALLRDLDDDLIWTAGRTLTSIFLGGGTPSLISPREIARLLRGVKDRIALGDACEITLEANPGTVTEAHLDGYLAAGVNRLSIGVQSFDDAMLRALGRIHDGAEAVAAIAAACRAGFPRLNLDLIHTLPGQTAAGALADLSRALAFDPGHISWYQLTIEPNTLFSARPPTLPDEAVQSEIERKGSALLTSCYRRYEISAYARPGEESRHNLNYWTFGDYIGIGPGAHGKITLPGQRRVLRSIKFMRPERYLEGPAYRAEVREVPGDQLPLEFLLNALRLTNGVSRRLFERRCGLPVDAIASFLEAGMARGLLRRNRRIHPTRRGQRFLNNLLELV